MDPRNLNQSVMYVPLNQTVLFDQASIDPENEDDIFVYINGLMGLAIILMNMVTLSLFKFKSCLLRTASNRLLMSLAVCDLCSGLVTSLHIIGRVVPAFKSETCSMCMSYRILVDIFTTFLTKAKVLHLVGIAIDRYICLYYALRYQKIVTTSKIRRYIVGIWLSAYLSACIPILWLYRAMDGMTDVESIKLSKYDAWYSVWSLFQFMIFPTFLLGWIFSSVFLEIRRLLITSPRHGRVQRNIIRQQRHASNVLLLMYASFTVFTVPYFTIRLVVDSNAWRQQEKLVYVHPLVLEACYTMKVATSLTNPMLYTIYNREFRIVLRQFIGCLKRRIVMLCFSASSRDPAVVVCLTSMQSGQMISSNGAATYHGSNNDIANL